jgi:hypothetical protein
MMRRVAAAMGALVLVVVVAIGADVVVRAVVERRATEALAETGLEFSPDAAVSMGGFPFLTQLARGRLTAARVTAESVVIDGVELTDVVATAHGLTTASPYTAEEVTLEATAPAATLTAAVAGSLVGRLGLDVEVSVEDDRLVASTRVLGLPATVTMRPEPAGSSIGMGVESASIAGLTVSVEDLPAVLRDALDGLEVPLDGLPDGFELTETQVVPDGLRLTAAGQDVSLETIEAVAP